MNADNLKWFITEEVHTKAVQQELLALVDRYSWKPRIVPPTKSGMYLVHNNMEIAKKLDIDEYHRKVEIMYFSVMHQKWATNLIVREWMELPNADS